MELPEISKEIWEKKYRFKTAEPARGDKDPESTFWRVARALAKGEADESRWASQFFDIMHSFEFLPAGRILAGAGTGREVTLFNCFVMGTIPDSMAGIFGHLKEAALTMQQGGGIGYDFSTIRYKGAPVKGVAADASGPLSFMDVWDAMCRTVMSAGERRGAMMATLRCDHPDILNFIEAKRDPQRLRMFNLSVLVTDAFMKAVKNDEEWSLVWGGKLHSVLPARALWDKIMEATYAQAEPGVIFIDRINKQNNLKYCETISATNPCGEQPLPPYGACLLGSVNLAQMIKDPFTDQAEINIERLQHVVSVAVRMLDNVVDVSNFPLPEQKLEAKAKRRIGLGVTGLADALAMMRLRYGSAKAADTTAEIMRQIAHAAYVASCNLAAEKGPFPAFRCRAFLDHTFASTLPTWIRDKIEMQGIRNSHLLSIAPTGTISLFAGNVSSGIEPIFAKSYTRKVLQADGTKVSHTVEDYAVKLYREMGSPDNKDSEDDTLPDYFVTVDDLKPEDHVRMQAAAQTWVDSSISKTVNVPENIGFDQFKAVYELAYNWGCKGCTTYRPNEISGSILSVEPKPEVPPPMPEELAAKKDALWAAMKKEVAAAMEDKAWEAVMKGPSLSDALAYAKIGVDRAAPNEAKLAKRPEALTGTTYKIKLGDTDAIYVTVTDVNLDGLQRPFEVFISTKNPQHSAWTTALTRMISAIFRRPHDSRFVVEELKAVFDPAGGGYWRGRYWHSHVAAIGQVIQDHMVQIGYWHRDAPEGQPKGEDVKSVEIPEFLKREATFQTNRGPNLTTLPAGLLLCPKCHVDTLVSEGGCMVCKSCGHSSCG